jgi:hypothetical protein
MREAAYARRANGVRSALGLTETGLQPGALRANSLAEVRRPWLEPLPVPSLVWQPEAQNGELHYPN